MSYKPLEFECPYQMCLKQYSTKYNLKRHIESTHTGIKHFVCSICSKTLSSKQNLNEHSYTHTKISPFKCEETGCGQIFRQRSQLSNHKKLHKELQLMAQQMRRFRELKVTII